jgi:hypothetical protein
MQADEKETMKQLSPEVHEAYICHRCNSPLFLKPLVQCQDCGEVFPLRCLSYAGSDGFYAECVDLSLLARGNTREEAIIHLQEQMFSYVAAVLERPAEGLIPRRAPLLSYIRYYLSAAKDLVLMRRHSHIENELQITGAKIFSHF